MADDVTRKELIHRLMQYLETNVEGEFMDALHGGGDVSREFTRLSDPRA
jgi:hypothetical protein